MADVPKVGKVIIEKGEVSPAQMQEIESGDFVTVSWVASKLNYSYTWVLWQLQLGRIRGIKPFGAKWRIPRSEYDRIVKEGLPPMPREEAAKPAVHEIIVDEAKVIQKVNPPPPEVKKKPPPINLFPWLFKTDEGGNEE